MNASGLRPIRFLAPIAGLGLLIASLAVGSIGSAAGELIQNGAFEEWAGSTPAGWSASGVVARVSSPSVSGQAASLADGATLSRTVPAQAGFHYTFSVATSAPGSATAELRVVFLDAGLSPAAAPVSVQQPVGAGFSTLSTSGDAPSGAAYASFMLIARGGTVVFDNASLVEGGVPPPTDTPAPTDTPSPSPTATATRAKPATATPPPPTATKTPRPTAVGATPTATTPGGAPGGAPPPPPGGGGGAVAPPAAGGAGGLLVNGDFEILDGDEPAFWAKFGGDLSAVEFAHGGAHAASLLSSTASTKWIYQVVPVTPGAWYEGSAFVLLPSSGGEAFLRLSWYAASDGSGIAIDQSDTEPTTAGAWSLHASAPIQAPAGAHSLRFRLMLRPNGPSAALFDDARLVEVPAPPAATLVATPTVSPESPGTPAAAGPPEPSVSATPHTASTATPIRPKPNPSGAANLGPRAPAAGPATLRLSEIMADPEESGRDSAYEWVELFNAGSDPVDLKGWKLADSKSDDVLPAAVVPPRGFVVVAGRSATFPAEVLVARVTDGELGSGLNNGGETVRLFAPTGEEVDAISFGSDTTLFDPAPPAPGAGQTLGALSPSADPSADNWAVTDRPTPGEVNTFPAKTLITKQATTGPVANVRATVNPGGPAAAGSGASVREDSGSDRWLPGAIFGLAAALGGAVGVPYLVRGWRRLKRGG